MLFQGEEWASSSPFLYFADHEDPELARQVTEGRRQEFMAFGWDPAMIPDPESRASFERSKLQWDELAEPAHAAMLHWYRELIRLRRSTQSLNNGEPGNTKVTYNEERRWLCVSRGSVEIACNLASNPRLLPLNRDAKLILASRAGVEIGNGGITLPPDAVAVLQTDI
jgi:maltooligosyltrehalose trehalohydrolase